MLPYEIVYAMSSPCSSANTSRNERLMVINLLSVEGGLTCGWRVGDHDHLHANEITGPPKDGT